MPHMQNTPDGLCEDCEDAVAIRTWDTDPYGYGPMSERYVSLCGECWTARDNYEPPEPDGEAFRGGEAAAYEAESQARIQWERRR